MSERVSLDSNVLVYAVDHRTPERQERALDIIRHAASSDCVLTTQALGEFLHVVSRKGMMTRADAADRVGELRLAFEVVGIDPAAFDAGVLAARESRYSVWDAILLATVERAGCTLLLSEDLQDGGRFGAVSIVNPFKGKKLPKRAATALGLR